MNIQVEINSEPYSGVAFKTNEGILIHLPGVQAASAPPFEAIFRGVPSEKINSGFLEVGEWNGKEYPFETQITFGIGPDCKVWAQIGALEDLPESTCEVQDKQDLVYSETLSNQELALRILKEAEEALGIKTLADQQAAQEGCTPPSTIGDYLFWLEAEAAFQEKAMSRRPLTAQNDEPYVRALRGVANELYALGIVPTATS